MIDHFSRQTEPSRSSKVTTKKCTKNNMHNNSDNASIGIESNTKQNHDVNQKRRCVGFFWDIEINGT